MFREISTRRLWSLSTVIYRLISRRQSTLLVFTARITRCCQQGYPTCPVKPWSSSIVRNVKRFTILSHHDITTQMGPTSEPDFRSVVLIISYQSNRLFSTCFSWSTLNTDRSAQLHNLSHVYTVSKSILWLINSSRLEHIRPMARSEEDNL